MLQEEYSCQLPDLNQILVQLPLLLSTNLYQHHPIAERDYLIPVRDYLIPVRDNLLVERELIPVREQEEEV